MWGFILGVVFALGLIVAFVIGVAVGWTSHKREVLNKSEQERRWT